MTREAYFTDGPLHRASWLRESTSFLNAAVTSAHARFLLLHHGKPLVQRTDNHHKTLYWATWADVQDAVLQTVRQYGETDASEVFGPTPYRLHPTPASQSKAFHTATAGLVTPHLSLVFLGIDERVPGPHVSVDSSLEVPMGAPCFALSLSYRAPTLPHNKTTACETLLTQLQNTYDILDMRVAIGTGALRREESAIIGCARALLDWNERYIHCPACGAKQYALQGGYKRACSTVLRSLAEKDSPLWEILPATDATDCISGRTLQNYAFPRTDPVVIIGIVHADGEKILLGRKKGWPKGFYSCIAGFVEQGESIEEAAKREALEETGLVANTAVYHSSQPWPFPAQLIFGILVQVESPSAAIRLDLDKELEEAFFVSKTDVQAILRYVRREGPPVQRHGYNITVPGRRAMAHMLLASWVKQGLQPDPRAQL
ncbi:NADH pyrophosphatase [Malassezia pachydermatis]